MEQKIFHSSKDLLNNLSKYNEYVIINLLVWNIINNGKYNNKEGIINYEVKENKIILFFGSGAYFYFKYDSNIININKLLSSSTKITEIKPQIQKHMNEREEPLKKIN